MQIERLKELVTKTAAIDVRATFDEFRGEGGEVDADRFLQFLRRRDLLDGTSFVELHGQEEIELDPTPLGADAVRSSSRYVLLGPVGEGAMGVVHVARDLDLRRKVAFKTMLGHDTLQTRRFLDEVQITAQLDHPNVVPVYSIERDESGRPAYAMKLVRGRTLKHILETARRQAGEGRVPDEEHGLAARLDHFVKVADAVAYAHSKGVIHRDLKPDNVMVGRFGEVYVMDWGIAKLVGQADLPAPDEDTASAFDRTRVGAVIGTPAYMSPEQANGDVDAVGSHSDQYALGLVLHEVVHLEPARRETDVVTVIAMAAAGRIDPPTAGGTRERIPPELDAIVARATATDPRGRYPSVDRLVADVRRALRGEETEALRDTGVRAARRWMVHNPRATSLVVLAIVTASVLAVTFTLYRQQVELAEERFRSQERERRIAEVVGRVSARAQGIDNDLLWYEGMLQGIADSAVYALARGTPTNGPWYHTRDYRDPQRAPADVTDSAKYGKPVSADFPVYTVAAGVPEPVWRWDLALLDGLRDTIRGVFLVDPETSIPPTDSGIARQRITEGARSLRWAYVALERSGLMYMFPGAAGWDDRYDPRTRPWYREAVGQRGRVWGKPYVDLMGQGRLVSCLLPLYEAGGGFLGVAGIDLQFEQLLDEHLKLPDVEGYEAAWLLTAEGRVMLDSAAEDDPVVIPPSEVHDPGIDFGTFDEPTVRAGAAAHQAGHVAAGERLYVWAPLQHLGWTYVIALRPPEE